MKKRALTGSRTSGSPHLGNYLGAYLPLLKLQSNYQLFFFLADFHALNENPPREEMERNSFEMIATLLACGLDPEKSHIYSQSLVPETVELSWILSCVTPYGMMTRAHSFKDAQAKSKEINMGVFLYPLLMAADILLYDAEVVPVGKDQKQHLEMARDMAQKFNHLYGSELLKLPEALIQEDIPLLPGVDGEKMSKSKNNVISVFNSDKGWKKQVMSIVTGSETLEEAKDPERCHVFTLYKALATPNEVSELAEKYKAGGYGYGHAKLDLLNKIKEIFSPLRDRYHQLMEHPDDLKDILRSGSSQVREIAQEKLHQIHAHVGFLSTK